MFPIRLIHVPAAHPSDPLELAPADVPTYLEQLWSPEQQGSTGSGANTFCLLIWQPAWAEQQLIRTGRLAGPITGQQTESLVAAGRQAVIDAQLPSSTPLAEAVIRAITAMEGNHCGDDRRGQYIDPALSALQPRRLITLAPTIDTDHKLETLVAAYCPLPEEAAAPPPAGMWWCSEAARKPWRTASPSSSPCCRNGCPPGFGGTAPWMRPRSCWINLATNRDDSSSTVPAATHARPGSSEGQG